MNNILHRVIRILAMLALLQSAAPFALAQEAGSTAPGQENSARTIQRLDSLSPRISELQDNRAAFITERGPSVSDLSDPDKIQLQEMDAEIEQLSNAFELIALGDVDTAAFAATSNEPFNWQQELTEVAAPIVDSIKNVTEKSRQLGVLRDAVAKNKQQIRIANQAITTIDKQTELPITGPALEKLQGIRSSWEAQRQSIEDQLVTNEARFEILKQNEIPFSQRVRNGMRSFVLGRGLTLMLAVLAGFITWLLMRAIWWVANNRFMTKNTRRKAVWFRLLSYSFALLTGVVMFIAFIAVLQVRQDTLLLAIALVLVVTAALGLRNYLPNYINETRLLLNIGPVREDERIMMNGIPWNVESINLQTVLRNPALNGVIRLPIADIKHTTSRPYRDDLWFPSERGDYILLPGDQFGQVLEQTPELVQIRVSGGMIKSLTASEYYAMPITNLSRGKTFGIATTFGLDYSIQNESLGEVPKVLKSVVQEALTGIGQEKAAREVMVELNEAGASSLDYMIYATFPSENASDYYRFGRTIRQACVQACNENGWSIPYPQMVMHQA